MLTYPLPQAPIIYLLLIKPLLITLMSSITAGAKNESADPLRAVERVRVSPIPLRYEK